jgi:hypothetical protein
LASKQALQRCGVSRLALGAWPLASRVESRHYIFSMWCAIDEQSMRHIMMIGFHVHCPPCGRHFSYGGIYDALGRAIRAIAEQKSVWRSLRWSFLAGRLAPPFRLGEARRMLQ